MNDEQHARGDHELDLEWLQVWLSYRSGEELRDLSTTASSSQVRAAARRAMSELHEGAVAYAVRGSLV